MLACLNWYIASDRTYWNVNEYQYSDVLDIKYIPLPHSTMLYATNVMSNNNNFVHLSQTISAYRDFTSSQSTTDPTKCCFLGSGIQTSVGKFPTIIIRMWARWKSCPGNLHRALQIMSQGSHVVLNLPVGPNRVHCKQGEGEHTECGRLVQA